MASAVSSSAVNASPSAAGSSLTGYAVTVTVAVAQLSVPMKQTVMVPLTELYTLYPTAMVVSRILRFEQCARSAAAQAASILTFAWPSSILQSLVP
jgi:hypothetical protein